MCGIAGLIWKGGASSDIGTEMTQMLQALKHRGPDSTGFALYGKGEEGVQVLRFKVAEQEEMSSGFDIHKKVIERKAAVDERLEEMGAEITQKEEATEYAFRYHFKFGGDLKRLIDFIEDLDGVEILSVGKGLELIKDLGDAACGIRAVWSERFCRYACNWSYAYGNRVGCRYSFCASLLGLPV